MNSYGFSYLEYLHALQESGCLRGKAKPLSMAASLIIGSLTTTHSESYKEMENVASGNDTNPSNHCPLVEEIMYNSRRLTAPKPTQWNADHSNST